MTTTASFGPGSRFLITCAAAVIVVAGLRAAGAFLVPLVLAVYLAALSAPLLRLFPRIPGLRRIPHWVSALLTALAAVLVVGLVGIALTVSVKMLIGSLPAYRERLTALVDPLLAHAARAGIDTSELRDRLFGPTRALGIVQGLMGSLLGLLSDGLLILLLYVFALLGAPGHGESLREALGDAAPERLRRMLDQAQGYLRLKTIISLCNGAGMALLAIALGVDFPLLWGFLAFVLNYIPNLGSIVATALPALLALVSRGLPAALTLVVGAILLDQVLSRVVEPRLMGRSLGLPPLVVVIALLFWGRVWGPVGVVLAVPLTTTLKIVLDETEDLRWLSILGSVAAQGEVDG